MDELNIDFGGYQDHKVNGGADRLTIGYIELIAPMIKAIQQLNEKVNLLKQLSIEIGEEVKSQNKMLDNMVCDVKTMQSCLLSEAPLTT